MELFDSDSGLFETTVPSGFRSVPRSCIYYVGGYKLPSAATHHQLRVDVVQEPAEVLALELFPELPPLCHAAAVGLRYVLVKRQVVKNLRQVCVKFKSSLY